MRQVIEEVEALSEEIMAKLRTLDNIEEHPGAHVSMIVSHQRLLRNKRCLLAYLYVLSIGERCNLPSRCTTDKERASDFEWMAAWLRHARTEKIKNLRWETGTIIPATLAPK